MAMIDETINIAEAKKHFSEILGQVAYGKKHILITKRGKPMARLVPADEIDMHLSNAKGWLDNNDPFFEEIDRIVQERSMHPPRIIRETPAQ
jgi:prevent-host-death family protein